MKKIDHIALVVDNPEEVANWYIDQFEASHLYSDESWALVEFENIKMAFVRKGTHPAHFGIKIEEFAKEEKIKTHRDGTLSVYKKDPWGNIYELIKYPESD